MGAMTKINFTTQPVSQVQADLLVLYYTDLEALAQISPELSQAASAVDAENASGKRTLLPGLGVAAKQVALVGTELAERAHARDYDLTDAVEVEGTGVHRHYSAVAVRPSKAKQIALAGDYHSVDDVIQAGIGALVATHGTDPYDHETAPGPEQIVFCLSAQLQRACESGQAAHQIQVRAKAILETIDLVNRAPNDLFPQAFAELAAKRCEGLPIEVEIWDEGELERQRCGGIIGVGQGSARGPRLAILKYRPQQAGRHLALVGKGITFDSGGLSLKPPASMETMKSDMAGAASVLSAIIAAAELGTKTAVTAYLAMAENMPSGRALRPCDVIEMRNGVRVEVTNTDAEGRLVMADALSLAAESDADAIIDVATLTGAQMVGLGVRIAGVMGSRQVREEVLACATKVGEPMWAMPLPSYLRGGLKSDVAQLKNSGPRWGGMLTAGVFLEEFVANKAWGHIDIAGPSFNESEPWGANNKGATGMSVLTLIEWLSQS